MDEFTIRNPSSQRTNKNNDIVLDYQLRTQALGENSKLWQLLVNMADSKNGWEVFSNHTLPKEYKDMKPEVSLESWHDNIHNLIGSGRQATGNMSQVPVAAVSPIRKSISDLTDLTFSLIRSSGYTTGMSDP